MKRQILNADYSYSHLHTMCHLPEHIFGLGCCFTGIGIKNRVTENIYVSIAKNRLSHLMFNLAHIDDKRVSDYL